LRKQAWRQKRYGKVVLQGNGLITIAFALDD